MNAGHFTEVTPRRSTRVDRRAARLQMAQSAGSAVGCAVQKCEGMGALVVCNYDAPNFLDSPIYTPADAACSACAADRDCDESSGLCVERSAAISRQRRPHILEIMS